MVVLKSLAVGLAAVVAYIVALVAYFLLELWWQSRQAGSGGIGAVAVGLGTPQFFVGLAIFAVAFWWEWRRATSRR